MTQYAWAVLGLGLWAAGVGVGTACSQAAPSSPMVELKQNFPNPFNPATTIPFSLNGALFANGRRPTVSLRIYNVLAQLVAIPVLKDDGRALDNVGLSCLDPGGCSYFAYWDGSIPKTGQQVASGVYIYQLIVDGTRYTKKMIVMK